jgi:acyl-CoA thioester hydrolase
MLKTIGLDFDHLHREGWDPVVIRAEIDYRSSLKSGDLFLIRSRAVAMGKLRFIFEQEIVRTKDQIVCAHARITAATLFNGRPSPCDTILNALQSE